MNEPVRDEGGKEMTDFGTFMYIVGIVIGFAFGAIFGWLVF